jgi:predicted SnoaL-like aldol condensation-catalyzing enzyme
VPNDGKAALRIKDGILVEHWDVIQDEATQEQSKSGLPE